MATSFGLNRPSSGQNIYRTLNTAVYSVLLVSGMGSLLQSYKVKGKGKGKVTPKQAYVALRGPGNYDSRISRQSAH
jgi:hypothetical protein